MYVYPVYYKSYVYSIVSYGHNEQNIVSQIHNKKNVKMCPFFHLVDKQLKLALVHVYSILKFRKDTHCTSY